MRPRITEGTRRPAFGLLLLCVALASPPAPAEIYSIPAAAFRPIGQIGGGVFRSALYPPVQGWVTGGIEGVDSCVAAPVYLPDGAIVTEMRAFFIDDDLDHSLEVQLRRRRITTGAAISQIMAFSGSTVNSPNPIAYAAPTIVNPIIDNSRYEYFLFSALCPRGSETAIVGVVLETDNALFADGFESADTSAWSATLP